MNFRIFLEWDEQCGIPYSKMYPLIDEVRAEFEKRQYGESIILISVVMTCMAKDLKQRKRFKKAAALFGYDILWDFYLNKNVDMDQKKAIIRRQIIEITEQTFSKYKFDNFNKAAFLSDMKEIVNTVNW